LTFAGPSKGPIRKRLKTPSPQSPGRGGPLAVPSPLVGEGKGEG